MEALLLLWENAPQRWTISQLGARLYVGRDTASKIAGDLVRRRLLRSFDEGRQEVAYDPAWDVAGDLMAKVAAVYRRNLILVAQVIHAKASGAVREFARAFEIKQKD
jgi:hypothetical protein